MKQLRTISETVKDFTKHDIYNKSKKEENVFYRWIYMKLAKDFTNYSLDDIGKEVNRTHATVIHGLSRFEIDIKCSDKYYGIYLSLYNALKPCFNKPNPDIELAGTIMNLDIEIIELRLKVSRQKEMIDNLKTLNAVGKQEINLLSLFRSLDEIGKRDAIFKINTAKKVRERLEIH